MNRAHSRRLMREAAAAEAWASGIVDPGFRVCESSSPRLLDRVRDALRVHHYSRRTERAYVAWIRRYILFHGKRHPAEMGAEEVSRFLTALAVEARVSASTQNQALAALLFLYAQVLGNRLPWLDDLVRATRPRRLPVVLSRDEVRAILERLDGTPRLMTALLYGTGMRLLECARLRIKDVDFGANQVIVRGGKGDRDRVTLLHCVGTAGAATASRAGVYATRTRSRRRRRLGGAAPRAGAQAAERRPRMAMAVGVPGDTALH